MSRTAAEATSPVGTGAKNVPNIGRSVVIKGELTGSEDLIIDGRVDGTINLRQHRLTVGPGGKIKAEVSAKAVVVLGQVDGNITASERIEIREEGSVEGDVSAPVVGMAEGAHFRGSIDMRQPDQAAEAPPPARPKKPASSKAGGVTVTRDATKVEAPSAPSPPTRS
jgi:cytoskeletal protein CcmA (bactofilin family)